MADTTAVRATDFVRNFARCQHEALRGRVIVVTSHDRVVGGYLSADELALYESLKAREREMPVVSEPDDMTTAGMESAQSGAEAG